MWNDIAQLRSLSSFLQWFSIGLVFISGFLQVGKFIVDRREKALSDVAQAEKLYPVAQSIHTGTAVVELVQDSKDAANDHFMDSGAALAFARENDALMILRSLDSFAVQNGKGEILWRATLNLDLGDISIGKPLRILRDAEYIELTFGQLKTGAIIKTGSITVTLNSAVRLRATIPPQTVNEQQLFFIRQFDEIKSSLQ